MANYLMRKTKTSSHGMEWGGERAYPAARSVLAVAQGTTSVLK